MSRMFLHAQAGPIDCGVVKTAAAFLLLLFAILWACEAAKAQVLGANAQPTTMPHTTVVIFADHRMEDRQWTALTDALRRSQMEAAAESRSMVVTYDIVRGDAMEPGLRVESAVVVYLHGDCSLVPLVRRTAFGVPLGWVREEHGRIEPFAHVDCTRIGQVLGPQMLGLNADRRNVVMAGAIARVILHEWIHIATQSAAHTDHGIARAQFGVADLMAGDVQPVARLRNRWWER